MRARRANPVARKNRNRLMRGAFWSLFQSVDHERFLGEVSRSHGGPHKMTSTGVLPPKKRAKADRTFPGSDLDINDDDNDGPVWHAEFDLAPRIDQLPRHADAAKAMRVSGLLRSRAVKHVMWWNTSARNPHAEDMYPLSHLTFAHNTGVHSFGLNAGCCITMRSFLENRQNYDAEGWLVMAGKSFPGYAGYPYVQSPLGQVSVLQEVSVHPIACATSQSSLLVCTPPLIVPVLQRKTVRVSGKAMCDIVLAGQPEVRELVDAVRVALRLPDSRRNPEARTPSQPKGKCIRALHFLLQDNSEQASFSWHDDASDIGHEGMHMTTVIVNLSAHPSCMRMWGFQPFLFQGTGAACAFAGAALHESVPLLAGSSAELVRRKVALFFA